MHEGQAITGECLSYRRTAGGSGQATPAGVNYDHLMLARS